MHLLNKHRGKSSGKHQEWGNLDFSCDELPSTILFLSHNNSLSESRRFNWANGAAQILTRTVLTYTWMENVTVECNDGKCTQYLIRFYEAESHKNPFKTYYVIK